MLQQVALGQARFVVPGLGADDRGVAVGRRLLCLFADVPRALGLVRTLSRQGALKDLLGSLVMETVVARSGLREVALSFDVQGSFQADGCAAAARAHQGAVFTGADPHFVPYRDAGRPLGVDVLDPASLSAVTSGYALYTEAGADVRTVAGPLELRDLLMRMALTPLRPAELRESKPDAVVLRVARGLLPTVRRYLWRRRVSAELTLVRLLRESSFEGDAPEVGLVRCRDLPPGALQLMSGTPGVEVFEPVVDGVLVERGWRHPVALESAASLFGPEAVLLFRGGRRGVERVAGPLRYVSLEDVTPVELLTQDGQALPQARALDVMDVEAMGVHVHLVADPLARGSAEAALIPTDRLPDLLALVHLMPDALWQGSEVAMAQPYTVVLSPPGVPALPLGHAVTAMHPRVFVPVGMRFSPRLSDELAAQHFGLMGNDLVVFHPPAAVGPPLALSRSAFVPLSRAAVHPDDLQDALDVVTRVPGLVTAGEPVVFHPTGAALRAWEGAGAAPPPVDVPPQLPPRPRG